MSNQVELLKKLCLKLKYENKTKEDILKTFVSAKILYSNGNFTKEFYNINKILKL